VRSIIHLDADAFFASVEQASDVRLRGKPMAVGGEKRGIIASASYEARKFGIYTPMPTVVARRLCPKLILVPGDFEKYELFSRLMFSYAYDFTPDVEIGSIDEGYFDLTGVRKPAVGIADRIRQAIRQSLRLSVSEGIGTNKLISQIASKLRKPAAFEFVPAGNEAAFLSPLANKWLPGIGPKTATQLNAAGLARIGQIAQTPADLLSLLVGSMAAQLRSFALGIDERPVVPARAPAKSYGEQETFAADTTDEEFIKATLRRMADKLMAKVREDGKTARTITVKVRYNDMDEEQAAESLEEPTDLETDIYFLVAKLLSKAWSRRVSLRLVSLRLSNLYDSRFCGLLALEVSDRRHDAEEKLAVVVDRLREKFGRSALLRGHDFILRDFGVRRQAERDAAVVRGESGVALRLPPHSKIHASPYNLAVVQRQRLGHYASRQPPEGKARRISIGPELRFQKEVAQVFQPAVSPTFSRQNTENADERSNARAPGTFASHAGAKPAIRQTGKSALPIPLNVHSYYSFLDSTLSIKAIIELAKRHELPAIALTDKSNLHGAVEFAQAAAQAGIKPIIGAEIEVHGHRLCLYVQNQIGYRNLCRILNTWERRRLADEAQNSKFKVQGSTVQSSLFDAQDSSFSSSDTDGLLALSPSPEFAPPFPDRFYLEINSLEALEKEQFLLTHHASRITEHGTRDTRPLPCTASLPIHYALPSDRWKYDIVQSIRTLTLLRQQHPEKRLDGEYHFRPPAEMQKLFAAHPELLAHSREIADRCSFQFSLGKPQFPGYTPPDGLTPAEFLRRLVMQGLRRRYPKDHARLKPQLELELSIITDVGYEEYFLVMWDILQECRRRGIEWITRGSAADSLACYCLEISSVCPIRFDLYFRRFLNKDRMALNKLPDIDVDFPHDRKDDVVDLIFEKFGEARTAVVGGFSTFQSRSAFAEVAKVLGVSEFQVRRLTERLPSFSRAGELAEAIAGSLECRDLPFQEEPYRSALQMAHFLDGFPRYPKMHPCGLVLSRQPMEEITPCFISAKGYPTTHFDMDSVESVGLVKMDILAQGGLAVMRDVQEMLQTKSGPRAVPGSQQPLTEGREQIVSTRSMPSHTLRAEDGSRSGGVQNAECGLRNTGHGTRSTGDASGINFASLEPWQDPEVWKLIASGQGRAVHHIESPAMISLCKMCNVRDIDTLIAIVSVIRPGAANESKKMEFARRYQGLSPVYYPHPSLEPCLRSTYGLVVYEEHILQICEAFAGLPPGRADVLRRALGKDRTDIIDEIKIEFVECARKRGLTEAKIAEVWDLVVGFRGYAFCKAHSTAYGVEAYQSAWLKRYYPAEFMAAVLTNGKGFYNPIVYILECHRLGIPLLPPSVNQPGPAFTVQRNAECSVQSAEWTDSVAQGSRFNSSKFNVGVSFFTQLAAPELSAKAGHATCRAEAQSGGGSRITHHSAIRVPLLNIKGLTLRTKERIIQERERAPFSSLHDFFLRVHPLNEEMEALIRSGAFDEFGKPRTTQYWSSAECRVQSAECGPRAVPGSRSGGGTEWKSEIKHFQPWLLQPASLERLPSVPLEEPERLQCLRWEEELFGYPVSGHPLELYPNIAWDTYCPIHRLGEHIGRRIVTCGLVIEQRLFHQVTGEPMKFITIADWTGVIETELFARTYRSYGLNTVRYRVLEITATVEPFENNRGFTLRVLRAGKPRNKSL